MFSRTEHLTKQLQLFGLGQMVRHNLLPETFYEIKYFTIMIFRECNEMQLPITYTTCREQMSRVDRHNQKIIAMCHNYIFLCCWKDTVSPPGKRLFILHTLRAQSKVAVYIQNMDWNGKNIFQLAKLSKVRLLALTFFLSADGHFFPLSHLQQLPQEKICATIVCGAFGFFRGDKTQMILS